MAAVEGNMASRRLPLASVPNAVNSPIRAGTIGKRTRLEETHDLAQGPPAKKQMLVLNQENVDPRAELGLTKVDDGFPKRSPHTQPTPLEKKLAASRVKKQLPKPADAAEAERQAKQQAENLESVRQWQRHYRRQFPSFMFYFDAVPDDVRLKCRRNIQALGAREEAFFSRMVTHVVTTRQIPTATTVTKTQPASVPVAAAEQAPATRKPADMFDQALQKRNLPQMPTAQVKTAAQQPQDVLLRAKELNIKLWPMEKFQRIIRTMFDADTGEQGPSLDFLHNVPATTTTVTATKPAAVHAKDKDLEALLRQEKITGPADRDPTVAHDLVEFKGCYIYIHDMDERYRPVMMRDYAKPAVKTDGKWPQFHMTSQGRCPFVEDTTYNARREQEKAQRDIERQRRTRASVIEKPQALGERDANLRRSPRKTTAANTQQAKPLDPPKLIPARRTSQEEVPLFANVHTSSRPVPKMIGGMPVASGLQQSNVTSAIRSQIVSSNAISSTAPGMSRRLTDSKEITALKRKVLERGASAHSQAPSSYINDMRAAINDESAAPPQRAAKRKAQESILGVVHEDAETSALAKQKAKKRKAAEKDPKPGYCENCKDKFEDFEQHINSRVHQKFARSADNFKDLDALLAQLKRPHRGRLSPF